MGIVLGSIVLAAVPANFVREMITDHNVNVCEKVTGKYCSSSSVGDDTSTHIGPFWLMFAVLFTVVGLNLKDK